MNVGYAYFVAQPNQLRFDVRDSFEEFITGISEQKGTTGPIDERPLAEQAFEMLDQLAEFERMMGTVTISEVIAGSNEPPVNEVE